MPDDLLETSVAARLLGLTPEAVRVLNKKGRLVPALRTSRGWSLYFRRDVEKLAEARKRAAAAAPKQPVTAAVEAVSPDLAVNRR